MTGLSEDFILSAAQAWMDFLVFLHGILVPNLVTISAGAAGFVLFYSMGRIIYRIRDLQRRYELQEDSKEKVWVTSPRGFDLQRVYAMWKPSLRSSYFVSQFCTVCLFCHAGLIVKASYSCWDSERNMP
jgi:hypothetical protein